MMIEKIASPVIVYMTLDSETLLAYQTEDCIKKVSNNLDLEMIILDIMMPKVDGLEVCEK